VVSHPDGSQSHQVHLTMLQRLQHSRTYNTQQWTHKQINLTAQTDPSELSDMNKIW